MNADFLKADIDIKKMMGMNDLAKTIDLMTATQIMRYALTFPEDVEVIQTKMTNFLNKYTLPNERSN